MLNGKSRFGQKVIQLLQVLAVVLLPGVVFAGTFDPCSLGADSCSCSGSNCGSSGTTGSSVTLPTSQYEVFVCTEPVSGNKMCISKKKTSPNLGAGEYATYAACETNCSKNKCVAVVMDEVGGGMESVFIETPTADVGNFNDELGIYSLDITGQAFMVYATNHVSKPVSGYYAKIVPMRTYMAMRGFDLPKFLALPNGIITGTTFSDKVNPGSAAYQLCYYYYKGMGHGLAYKTGAISGDYVETVLKQSEIVKKGVIPVKVKYGGNSIWCTPSCWGGTHPTFYVERVSSSVSTGDVALGAFYVAKPNYNCWDFCGYYYSSLCPSVYPKLVSMTGIVGYYMGDYSYSVIGPISVGLWGLYKGSNSTLDSYFTQCVNDIKQYGYHNALSSPTQFLYIINPQFTTTEPGSTYVKSLLSPYIGFGIPPENMWGASADNLKVEGTSVYDLTLCGIYCSDCPKFRSGVLILPGVKIGYGKRVAPAGDWDNLIVGTGISTGGTIKTASVKYKCVTNNQQYSTFAECNSACN